MGSTGSTGRRFRGRNFTSLLATLFFLALFVSGVVLYVAPKGRVAHWMAWRLLGLDKDQWQSVHVNASLIFLIVMIFHLVINWRSFWKYCRSRLQKGIRISSELTAALVLGVVVVAASITGLPPFGTIMEVEEEIKASWEHEVERGPIPHAEDLSLEDFARAIGMPLDEALAALRAHGIPVGDPQENLRSLAKRSSVAPSDIHAILVPRGGSGDRRGGQGTGQGTGRGGGQGAGQGGGQGRGLGRATLEQLAARAGIGVDRAIEILGQRGIPASPGDNARALAGRHGLQPTDLLRMLEGE